LGEGVCARRMAMKTNCATMTIKTAMRFDIF
jgi:hypothetical protein